MTESDSPDLSSPPVRVYETATQHQAKMACRDYLTAQHRMHYVNRLGADDWLEQELMAVTVAANNWATATGGHTVTIDQVRMYDQLATGADWVSKLALYVAEAVVYGESRQP